MSYSIINPITFSHQSLYELVDNYFDHPVLEKTKNEKDVSVYMCMMSTLLGGFDKRYLIAIVPIDSAPVGTKTRLINIYWKSFQARTIAQDFRIVKHSYSAKNEKQYVIKVNKINRDLDHTEYMIEGFSNVLLTLLHKNKILYEYPDTGNLASALETFKTVIVLQ